MKLSRVQNVETAWGMLFVVLAVLSSSHLWWLEDALLVLISALILYYSGEEMLSALDEVTRGAGFPGPGQEQ
jgi:divalent metal cation (Fe/Co/Zn/Cd) transporter